ncbi:caspase-8-like isoform X1 [Lates japonicus]|uniref:Caspase-8 n=1 Tax=Lates japonicus TaxID=270547 RepID=A0AAD3NLD7_LATJO|nr:caspase-8-like isoform X1 [Lates japonicus]
METVPAFHAGQSELEPPHKKSEFNSEALTSEQRSEQVRPVPEERSKMDRLKLSRHRRGVESLRWQHFAFCVVDVVSRNAWRGYKDKLPQQELARLPPHFSMDYQPSVNNNSQPTQPTLSISETISGEGENTHTDAEISRETSSLPNEDYALTHIPRGLCVVINNESFSGPGLSSRGGTQEDAKALRKVFYRLGFEVVIHDNLTAGDMRQKLKELSRRNYLDEDALVVCVLSHGEQGCVFGTDEQKVLLRELTEPFTSKRALTLTGKPKLFFIQACQGSGYQGGTAPCPPRPRDEAEVGETVEEDAGPVFGETVPWDADFLLGMATVQDCKSFRNTSTGSIYIQELCKQLTRSAESSERENILDILTRVNREVSKGVYLSHKQMPEPKYTLTKRLVLKFGVAGADTGEPSLFSFFRRELKAPDCLLRSRLLFGVMSRSDYPPGYDDSRGPLYAPQGGSYPPPPAYGFPAYGGPQPGQPVLPTPLVPTSLCTQASRGATLLVLTRDSLTPLGLQEQAILLPCPLLSHLQCHQMS